VCLSRVSVNLLEKEKHIAVFDMNPVKNHIFYCSCPEGFPVDVKGVKEKKMLTFGQIKRMHRIERKKGCITNGIFGV
jgi:hypothetical protein